MSLYPYYPPPYTYPYPYGYPVVVDPATALLSTALTLPIAATVAATSPRYYGYRSPRHRYRRSPRSPRRYH